MLELGDVVYNAFKDEYGEVVATTKGFMYGIMYNTYDERRHDLHYEQRRHLNNYFFSNRAYLCEEGYGWYEFEDELVKVTDNKQYLLFP